MEAELACGCRPPMSGRAGLAVPWRVSQTLPAPRIATAGSPAQEMQAEVRREVLCEVRPERHGGTGAVAGGIPDMAGASIAVAVQAWQASPGEGGRPDCLTWQTRNRRAEGVAGCRAGSCRGGMTAAVSPATDGLGRRGGRQCRQTQHCQRQSPCATPSSSAGIAGRCASRLSSGIIPSIAGRCARGSVWETRRRIAGRIPLGWPMPWREPRR